MTGRGVLLVSLCGYWLNMFGRFLYLPWLFCENIQECDILVKQTLIHLSDLIDDLCLILTTMQRHPSRFSRRHGFENPFWIDKATTALYCEKKIWRRSEDAKRAGLGMNSLIILKPTRLKNNGHGDEAEWSECGGKISGLRRACVVTMTTFKSFFSIRIVW